MASTTVNLNYVDIQQLCPSTQIIDTNSLSTAITQISSAVGAASSGAVYTTVTTEGQPEQGVNQEFPQSTLLEWAGDGGKLIDNEGFSSGVLGLYIPLNKYFETFLTSEDYTNGTVSDIEIKSMGIYPKSAIASNSLRLSLQKVDGTKLGISDVNSEQLNVVNINTPEPAVLSFSTPVKVNIRELMSGVGAMRVMFRNADDSERKDIGLRTPKMAEGIYGFYHTSSGETDRWGNASNGYIYTGVASITWSYTKPAGESQTVQQMTDTFTTFLNSDELTQKILDVAPSAGSTALPLTGKKLSIVGDSISTFEGYIPTAANSANNENYAAFYKTSNTSSTGVASVDQTWWKMLVDETGLTLLRNASWSGSRATGAAANNPSAYSSFSNSRIADLSSSTDGTPDVVICLIGINDLGRASGSAISGDYTGAGPLSAVTAQSNYSTFADGYAVMLDKIQTAYPDAVIYCCSLLATTNANTSKYGAGNYPIASPSGVALPDYNTKIKQLAAAFGCRFIDTYACGINIKNIEQNSNDKLHPNFNGMKKIKEYIKRVLVQDLA